MWLAERALKGSHRTTLELRRRATPDEADMVMPGGHSGALQTAPPAEHGPLAPEEPGQPSREERAVVSTFLVRWIRWTDKNRQECSRRRLRALTVALPQYDHEIGRAHV